MKKWSPILFSMVMAGCTAQSASSTQGRITANADAQHAGVYSYALEANAVTLFDKDGIELGQIGVTAPSDQGRHFVLAFADGTTDEVDVVRPGDYGFFAPISPETPLTAALGDPALAPRWAEHQVHFNAIVSDRLASTDTAQLASALKLDGIAVTTSCTTYSCGQSCSPMGCAKPANTSVGCSNPSQLPATSNISGIVGHYVGQAYTTPTACQAYLQDGTVCAGWYGGSASDWVWQNNMYCQWGGSQTTWTPVCQTGTSSNSWVASCPRQTCGIVGDYDSVPRNAACNSPGSCSYSQGTVGCTPYH